MKNDAGRAVFSVLTALVLGVLPGAQAAFSSSSSGSRAGQLQLVGDLSLPTLGEQRQVRVYLPPSYAQSPARRYPVLYLYDGERLFEGMHLRSTADLLASEGVEVILVAVDGRERSENVAYSAYLSDLVRTVKPYVDAHYRTLTTAPFTGIAGVASGGSVSIEGGTVYPEVFGFVGAISPLVDAEGLLVNNIWIREKTSTAYYLSIGTSEGRNDDASLARLMEAGQLVWALKANGARVGYVEVEGGAGTEQAWQARLPGLLRSFAAFAKSSSVKN